MVKTLMSPTSDLFKCSDVVYGRGLSHLWCSENLKRTMKFQAI